MDWHVKSSRSDTHENETSKKESWMLLRLRYCHVSATSMSYLYTTYLLTTLPQPRMYGRQGSQDGRGTVDSGTGLILSYVSFLSLCWMARRNRTVRDLVRKNVRRLGINNTHSLSHKECRVLPERKRRKYLSYPYSHTLTTETRISLRTPWSFGSCIKNRRQTLKRATVVSHQSLLDVWCTLPRPSPSSLQWRSRFCLKSQQTVNNSLLFSTSVKN